MRREGRRTPVSACATPAKDGAGGREQHPEIGERRGLLQMLFVEGNHFCPSCEKSGNWQSCRPGLRIRSAHPALPPLLPDRPVDASHPDVLLDFNRCIFCELCVASREIDGKAVFALTGRGIEKHLVVNAESGRLGDTDFSATDAPEHLPGRGVILPKGQGCRGADRRAPPSTSRRSQQDSRSGAMNSPAPCKRRVAMASLAGCFGCHMSFLDIDEHLLSWSSSSSSTARPHRHQGRRPCDIGLIEGGVCNAENVHVLREFRRNCKTLIALGACKSGQWRPAGPAQPHPVAECLREVYQFRRRQRPDPQRPRAAAALLDKVRLIHEVVRVDYFMPGCPPSGPRSGISHRPAGGRTPRLSGACCL